MATNYMVFLALHLLVVCNAYFESPKIIIQGKSLESASALDQAAAVLNVSVPANWADLMLASNTTGSYGNANIGMSTIDTIMAQWSIPEQFRAQAVNSVQLLVSSSSVGSLVAQAFTFDIPAGTSLTTLIIVATKMDSPTDPNLPYTVSYVTINTNAQLKQLQSIYYVHRCFSCSDCVWLWECCCKNDQHTAPRGDTPEELQVVKQKMTSDQFNWFIQQNISTDASKTLVRRAVTSDNDDSLIEDIGNYLSNPTVKAEILAPYNDSILTALQSSIASLKLSSQALTLNGIERENLIILLDTLAKENGFENIYSEPQYAQQLDSPRFSYENLFTSQTGTQNNSSNLAIKYIWILGQVIDNSTYTLNFLTVSITSKVLLETMLSNNTKDHKPPSANDGDKQVNIVRISTLTSSGQFINENLPTLITPWQQTTTQIVLDMLRFIAVSVLVPQKSRLLSGFNVEVIQPGTNSGIAFNRPSPKFFDEITALADAVSSVTNAIKGIVSLFSSSTSTTIQRIARFGFNYFQQKSTVLKAIGIPSSQAQEFINAVVIDYNLPPEGSFALGITYSSDFTWDQVNFLYSPNMSGEYRSLTLFKTGNSVQNTASFFIVDINANWTLAPDLLLITTSKSSWGGLFSSTQQSIQEVPHSLTFDEATGMQKFFMALALGNVANTLGLNVTYPQLN